MPRGLKDYEEMNWRINTIRKEEDIFWDMY